MADATTHVGGTKPEHARRKILSSKDHGTLGRATVGVVATKGIPPAKGANAPRILTGGPCHTHALRFGARAGALETMVA